MANYNPYGNLMGGGGLANQLGGQSALGDLARRQMSDYLQQATNSAGSFAQNPFPASEAKEDPALLLLTE